MTLEVVSPTAALLDGRYVLHEPVGRGGMATVYRAEDTHLERTVAIKMIHEGDGAISSIDRAHNEKLLLASVSHPRLVTLYDAQLQPQRPQYLVMEFVDGPTLADRMAEGPLPERLVARLLRDLAQGLSAVHAAGIVHRDLKPSNVLLAKAHSSRTWSAKLADFGIACTVGSSRITRPGVVLGTFTYMAPEQLRDAPPTTAVDIFALGLVGLEALTGEPGYPAIGATRGAAVSRLITPPSIPDSVPAAWCALLERMTRLEPDERPSAGEVARAARELLRGEVSDERPSATESRETPRAASSEAPLVAAPMSAAEASSKTEATAVMAPVGPAPRIGKRGKRRIAAALAGVAAAGAIVTGVSVAAAPAPEGPKSISAIVTRDVVPTTEAVDAPADEAAPVVPVQVATDDGGPGKSDKASENGNSGNSGNSGNNGNGNNGNNGKGNNGNGNTGKGEK